MKSSVTAYSSDLLGCNLAKVPRRHRSERRRTRPDGAFGPWDKSENGKMQDYDIPFTNLPQAVSPRARPVLRQRGFGQENAGAASSAFLRLRE